MKPCSRCRETLNDDQFYPDKSKKDKLSSRCKQCARIGSVERRAKNPEYQRSLEMRIRYGITVDEYNKLLHSQNNVCKICNKPCKSGMRLAVDHCHTTRAIRGLLCIKCNKGLGMFDDNKDVLKSAIIYLEGSL